MFISTIIPTIGRTSLSRAVNSVIGQGFQDDSFEVIVVNDSNKAIMVDDWQENTNVKVISTNCLNRSIARNTGAAIAKGQYLHFLDDDDWILPGAFETFWKATRGNSAAWIHGAFSMIDNLGDKIADIFPDETGNCYINLISWEWLPLQASIVEADAFFRVGGFEMLDALKGGFEDIHLARQIALKNDFFGVSDLVACIRAGDRGSTTNYKDIFIQNRQSREINLEMPGAYKRLISSARNNQARNGYWYGKVIYYLLVSAFKNFNDKRIFQAASRLFYVPMGMISAGKYLLSTDFWTGATKPHSSRVKQAIENSGKELFQNTLWNNIF